MWQDFSPGRHAFFLRPWAAEQEWRTDRSHAMWRAVHKESVSEKEGDEQTLNSYSPGPCSFSSHLNLLVMSVQGFPGGESGKEPPCQCRRHKRPGLAPRVGKILWSRKWQPSLVFLPGESHRQKSLEGYSPWGCTEPGMTEGSQHAM